MEVEGGWGSLRDGTIHIVVVRWVSVAGLVFPPLLSHVGARVPSRLFDLMLQVGK